MLQQRVAAVLAACAGLLLVFLVYSVVEDLRGTEAAIVSTSGWLFHISAVIVAGAASLYCRRGVRTVGQVYAADAAGMLVLGMMLGLMSSELHIGYRPEFTMLVGLTLIMMARAALVPSSAWRTALLCALLSLPLAYVTWRAYVGYVPPRADYPQMSSAGVSLFILLWWLAASALAVSTSRVIYGLRREVDRARQLGQYALEEKIGEGGMGQVYRASHAMLRRPTAIKLLLNASDQQLRLFEREVQLTASLTHPNTVAIFDYGRTPDGIFYYAMEYLEGLNLADLVERHGHLPTARVIHILRQVCAALAEAHAARLIHRDIKPANIILCERGGVADVAKVLDFGLVKTVDATSDVDGAHAAVTNHNVLVGTPLYMSPESIKSPDKVTSLSDLYAVGAVAYYLLTGQPPFEGESVVEVCGHHLHSTPAPPSEHVPVPEDLEKLVLQCLEKDPGGTTERCRRARHRAR